MLGDNLSLGALIYARDGDQKDVDGYVGQARAIAKRALNGFVETSVGEATHYHADYVLPATTFLEREDLPVALFSFHTTPPSSIAAMGLKPPVGVRMPTQTSPSS